MERGKPYPAHHNGRNRKSSPGQRSCRSWSMEGGSHSEHPLFTHRSYPGTASICKTWQTWFQELQPLGESQVLSSPLLFSVCIDSTNIFKWLQSWRVRSVVLVDASILLNNLTVIIKPTKQIIEKEISSFLSDRYQELNYEIHIQTSGGCQKCQSPNNHHFSSATFAEWLSTSENQVPV